MLSRRTLLGIVTSPLASPTGARSRRDFDYEDDNWVLSEPQYQPPSEGGLYDDWYIGEISDRPHPVPVVDPARVDSQWRPQVVSYPGPERSGTIVIRPRELFLYLVQAGRMARRYGIGVGRQGF
jgi:lipoprotein-anchoring transpeptidase ErfK/SrfK